MIYSQGIIWNFLRLLRLPKNSRQRKRKNSSLISMTVRTSGGELLKQKLNGWESKTSYLYYRICAKRFTWCRFLYCVVGNQKLQWTFETGGPTPTTYCWDIRGKICWTIWYWDGTKTERKGSKLWWETEKKTFRWIKFVTQLRWWRDRFSERHTDRSYYPGFWWRVRYSNVLDNLGGLSPNWLFLGQAQWDVNSRCEVVESRTRASLPGLSAGIFPVLWCEV